MGTPPFGVAPATQRLYDSLPTIYRASDEAFDWPLLRYLALTGGPLDLVETLLARIDYVGPAEGGPAGGTSELVDPAFADDEWLAWLAQHAGIPTAGRTAAELRAAVQAADAGGPVATKAAIIAAAQGVLTGSKFVDVQPGMTANSTAGTRWDLLIQTRTVETPSAPAVLAAVIEAGAKPAGVILHQDYFASSWAAIMAANPTLATLTGDTWASIMST